jgi:chaperonin GroEL
VAVRAPGFALRRRRMLDDMAVYTGGVTVSEETGLTLAGLDPSQLGRARRVVAERQRTTVIGGAGDETEVLRRRENLRREIEAADIAFHAKVLKERLDRLSAKVALIQVGGATETEIGERSSRVDDAVHAARAALQEGLVPGGGVALLNARDAIDVSALDGDERTGAQIVWHALAEPARQIASNSGFEAAAAVDRAGLGPRSGLDVTSGKVVDLVDAGVIDPTKVTRTALENAASVAKTVLAAEAIVVDVNT